MPQCHHLPRYPKKLTTSYDCYYTYSYNVLPEDLWIGSATKCVETLYQRFPNLTMRLYDNDNPNDVNDPANLRISIPAGETMVANYNANGGGIDYLFTGYEVFEQKQILLAPENGQAAHRVIVQVNKDATFLYWNWLDQANGPLSGVLDNADRLYGETIDDPMYIRSYERLRHDNTDCSGRVTCGDCLIDAFPTTKDITATDYMYIANTKKFIVQTFGVPTLVTNYGYYSGGDAGGEIRLALNPVDASSKLKVRVYTMNALYDYNSTIKHPPHFIYDPIVEKSGIMRCSGKYINANYGGIDYCGYREFKVLPPDPYVNFAVMKIVDHALQNSEVNYTSGFEPLSEILPPTPQIEAPYDPIVKDVGRDFRCYPGGQTHTGRIEGSVYTGSYFRSEGQHNGWNAYPAIWFWYWYDNIDYNDFTDYNKLGTEFYPLTDYTFNFIMKDGEGNHLSLDPNVDIDLRVRKLEITGPFMTPIVFNQDTKAIISGWKYNGVRNVPIKYDYSGSIVIDPSNWTDYELTGGDWTKSSKDGLYPKSNAYLEYSRDLDYTGLTNVIRIPEIIPVGNGNIRIAVTLWDNTLKIFQDCCAEPPTDGITSHGLEVAPDATGVTVMNDNKIEVTVKEYEPMQFVQPANNAVVVAWQDRGIRNAVTGLYDGAGDGWITNPPTSTDQTDAHYQYDKMNDLNLDGKVSFADYETEILGTYDLATNTWHSGIIDARTFQRDNGKYIFDLSSSNGAMVTQTGLDFGAFDKNGAVIEKPDHIISEFETLPVTITAYKYGDDNNNRSFTPLYNLGDTIPQFSHEVYLAGQAALDVLPMQDISVTVSPTVVTAGCIPELVDPASPLTIIVTDAEGNPVNLTNGVVDASGAKTVEKDDMWMHLFRDMHPEILPQYYWLRTDLHNKDYTKVNNSSLYNTEFYPIKADFSLAEEGKYTFNGFCANDQGEFDVYVYTPDRAHMGIGKVKVEQPNVEYNITNIADPAGNTFTVPGEPDFVMTAADNRIYRVTVTVKDARGILIKGVTKGVSTCGGGTKNTARFTPYSSRPESWNFSEKDRFLFAEHFMQDLYPYNLNVAFDFNDNQKIDWRNSELFTFGGFNHIQGGLVYYNTTNVMFDSLEWDVTPNVNLPPFSDPITQKPIRDGAPQRPENPSGTATIGWGLGSIYNSPYHGGLLLVDIDGTGYLDYHDSLGLDVNGQTTFYLFAEDLAWVGGLVGQNSYDNNANQSDLAGWPPQNKTDPAYIYKRFKPSNMFNYHPIDDARDTSSHDGVFFLDWEAFPNKEIIVGAPKIKVLYAENRMPLGKNLVDADKYDLTYSIENHLIVQVTPADPRDLPISEDGRIFMFGNQHQTAIYGNLKPSPQDPTIMETTLHFTPTGLGAGIAALGFYNKNKSYLQPPYDLKNTSTYTLMNLEYFDSAIGLYVEALTDGPVVVKQANELTVRVKEIGTMAPVEGATVKIEGPGISGTKTTDKSGVAIFPITANAAGIIKVTATKEGRNIGYKEIRILEDLTKPFLDLMPLPPYTNKPDIEVTGYTNPGNTVIINGAVTVTADNNGAFKGKVTLKEGLNTIIVESRNAKGEFVKGSVTTTLDTVPPNIFIDDPGELVDVTETAISGRTEPESTVLVNGVPFTLTHDIFRGTAKVVLGKNAITVTATDKAGNQATATRDIYVYHKIVIKITIDNPVALINDVPQPPLEASPFIWQGRTMVPVRLIAEGLGAQVNYDAPTKTVTVILGNDTIVMKIDDKYATINGKSVLLDAPPTIRSGRTFIPVRFVSEAFRAQVDWDAATRTVTVTYKK